jgi:hypothetical protein
VASLPRSWTDLARPDSFVERSGGRAWFRVGELLDLVHLIESVQEKAEEGWTDV